MLPPGTAEPPPSEEVVSYSFPLPIIPTSANYTERCTLVTMSIKTLSSREVYRNP